MSIFPHLKFVLVLFDVNSLYWEGTVSFAVIFFVILSSFLLFETSLVRSRWKGKKVISRMIFFSHTYGIRFFYSDERLRGMWFLFEYQLRSISSTDCIVAVIFYYFDHIANIYIDDVLWYRIASDNCLKFIRWF